MKSSPLTYPLLAAALLLATPLLATPVTAQIEVGALEDAQAFSAGTLDIGTGGLDRNAWSGTSADMATHLVGELPESFAHPLAAKLARAAILSSGVPPEGEQDAWRATRTEWLMNAGEVDALQALAARDLDLSRDQRFATDLALVAGDEATACATSDGILDGRSDPYWARLRAFCHVTRDEIPAAELTVELIDEDDPVFDTLFRALTRPGRKLGNVTPQTALHRAMLTRAGGTARSTLETARTPDADPKARLAGAMGALGTTATADLLPIMTDLATGVDAASYGFDDVRDDDSVLGTARLYVLAVQSRSAPAAAEFLVRADAAGEFAGASDHLADILQLLTPADAADAGLDVMTRSAVLRTDLGMLAGLYSALGESPEDAARIALVSDALGGGFRLRPIGEDIEMRLVAGGEVSGRAVRDSMIALALGAQLSDPAARALATAKTQTPTDTLGGILVLRAAAERGVRAETALRAARLLEMHSDPVTTSEVVSALQSAGLDRFARAVGAWDFASRI